MTVQIERANWSETVANVSSWTTDASGALDLMRLDRDGNWEIFRTIAAGEWLTIEVV